MEGCGCVVDGAAALSPRGRLRDPTSAAKDLPTLIQHHGTRCEANTSTQPFSGFPAPSERGQRRETLLLGLGVSAMLRPKRQAGLAPPHEDKSPFSRAHRNVPMRGISVFHLLAAHPSKTWRIRPS